jgi:hypothetical protein
MTPLKNQTGIQLAKKKFCLWSLSLSSTKQNTEDVYGVRTHRGLEDRGLALASVVDEETVWRWSEVGPRGENAWSYPALIMYGPMTIPFLSVR